MRYIKPQPIKEKFRKAGRQISKDGLRAIDIKIDCLIDKAIAQFDGHHKRVDSKLISLLKL